LEDEIEMQRQKKVEELKKSGAGTPVTEETFREWQERKRKAKEEAVKKMVEAEMKKKKGGKGLSVLSGRDLYTYKQSLFKDDDGAANIDDVDDEEEEEEKKNNGDASQEEDTQQQNGDVAEVAAKVESDLFLEGDDEDLDDLEDD
jgi:DRG Family Regulatory Proteins, Tma46